ncbi:hypothetical protein Trydic_g7723 [Trypoxylus dichotomus]
MLNNFGSHLLRIGEYEEAKKYLQLAHTLEPDFLLAEKNLMTLKGELIDRWHFPMLNDNERNMAYYKAILSYNTENNAKVLDIGTGCGLLSLFASNNENITSIQAIEDSKSLSAIAKHVFDENNENVIMLEQASLSHILESNSYKFDIIILNPICKNGTIYENSILNYKLYEMCLNPGGLIYPQSLNVVLQVVESDYLYNFNVVNDENLFGFHIANYINEYSVNEHFDLDKNFQHKKLSQPQQMGNILRLDNEIMVTRRQCPIQQCKTVDVTVYGIPKVDSKSS